MNTDEHRAWRKPRPVVERILVKGELVLQSPTHFGAGDVDPFSHVKMLLLRDPLENRALLPGASIAGALRSYLREWELGYYQPETADCLATGLFGVHKGQTEGLQSPLIVYDALAAKTSQVELRDGVKIEPKTRTAKDEAKFDMELLAAGTVFPLCFELVVEAGQRDKLVRALAVALYGLESGEIHLGARKQRGLGQVKIKNWEVRTYDLTTAAGMLGWLASERPDLAVSNQVQSGRHIKSLLAVDFEPEAEDQRSYFDLNAVFALQGSLLIRSGFGHEQDGPDTVHLHARQSDGNLAPAIPGSSLAGVIRRQALRIAQTWLSEQNAAGLVNDMFGYADKEDPQKSKASRVRVRDTAIKKVNSIEKVNSLVQSRIRIDRFTGGAHSSALFNEEPVFGREESALVLDLRLFNPTPAEMGLLLQVLKDLWVGDLPLGGESSVGRGRLQGKSAVLSLRGREQSENWKIEQQDEEPDAEGLDAEGLDAEGLDAEGLDAEGLNAEGLDAEGLDAEGLDAEGLDAEGLNAEGLNAEGLDVEGRKVGKLKISGDRSRLESFATALKQKGVAYGAGGVGGVPPLPSPPHARYETGSFIGENSL